MKNNEGQYKEKNREGVHQRNYFCQVSSPAASDELRTGPVRSGQSGFTREKLGTRRTGTKRHENIGCGGLQSRRKLLDQSMPPCREIV
jgi:hypothetical protein